MTVWYCKDSSRCCRKLLAKQKKKQRGRNTISIFPSATHQSSQAVTVFILSTPLSQTTLCLFVVPYHNSQPFSKAIAIAIATMDSSHSQSLRASSSDSLGGQEEKKCNEHADELGRVDAAAVPDSAFDDILTTVRKEEWYTVSQLLLHLIGIILSSVALSVIPVVLGGQSPVCFRYYVNRYINRACSCGLFDSFNQYMVDCATLPTSDTRLGCYRYSHCHLQMLLLVKPIEDVPVSSSTATDE
jgi:hypothetical protein